MRAIARRVFIGLSLGVAFLALRPDPQASWIEDALRAIWPLTPRVMIAQDVLNHVAAFFVLALVGAAGWGVRWRLAVGLGTAAAALEAAQAAFPPREPSWGDLWAGLAGAAAGLGLAAAGSALRVRRAP